MRSNLNRVAAVLAWLIGGMGVLAGGQTLLGRLPGWNVISWLPVYNVESYRGQSRRIRSVSSEWPLSSRTMSSNCTASPLSFISSASRARWV